MNISKVKVSAKSVWIEGSEDGWNTRQVFCDIHEVSGCLVAMSVFNQKPMFIVKDRADLLLRLRQKWPGASFE